jgi:hypothetical protein
MMTTVWNKDSIIPLFFWSNRERKHKRSFMLLTLLNPIQNYYSVGSSELWSSVAYGNVMFEVTSFGCRRHFSRFHLFPVLSVNTSYFSYLCTLKAQNSRHRHTHRRNSIAWVCSNFTSVRFCNSNWNKVVLICKNRSKIEYWFSLRK